MVVVSTRNSKYSLHLPLGTQNHVTPFQSRPNSCRGDQFHLVKIRKLSPRVCLVRVNRHPARQEAPKFALTTPALLTRSYMAVAIKLKGDRMSRLESWGATCRVLTDANESHLPHLQGALEHKTILVAEALLYKIYVEMWMFRFSFQHTSGPCMRDSQYMIQIY